MAHAESESVPAIKRIRTGPPEQTPDRTRDGMAASTAVAVAELAPLRMGGHSRIGINRLPAAVLGHALHWLGSCERGALAAASAVLRRAAIRHIRSTRKITLDVCLTRFERGHAADDTLRGCTIRGIRLLETHLLTATHIRRRTTPAVATTINDSIHADDRIIDAPRVDLALAIMIARNAATLQSVDLSEDGSDSFATVAALAGCRRLTALVGLVGGEAWMQGLVRTIITRNAGCLRKLHARPLDSATLAAALARLSLEDLTIVLDQSLDLAPLAKCATLQRLSLHNSASSPGSVVTATYNAIADALPTLTALQELRIQGLQRFGVGSNRWTFAPALTQLTIKHAEDGRLPEMSGSVTTLELVACDALIVTRLLRSFHATLSELHLKSVTRKPHGFLATLPEDLAACPRLRSLRISRFSTSSATLAAIVRACPLLAVLHAQVHSDFGAHDLAATLQVLQARLRELILHYGQTSEAALLRSHQRQHTGTDPWDLDEAAALRRMPQLVLPLLQVLKLHMCTDRLLRKLTCPRLTVLELLGAGVRLRRPLPPPAAFPQLETLALHIATESSRVARKGDGRHAHLTALTLSWEGAETSNIATNTCHFRAHTLAALLARCPTIRKLAFTDRTPAQHILATLAVPGPPSRICDLFVRTAIAATAPFTQVLADARALRTRHPLLSRVDVPCHDTLDPRLADALFG